MNQRWMGSVRKTTREAKKKGKRRLQGQQQLFDRPARVASSKQSSQRLLTGSIDLLALTFDSEPTLNGVATPDQGEEEDIVMMDAEEEEAEPEENLQDNRYSYRIANSKPNDHHEQDLGAPLHRASSTSKPGLKKMDDDEGHKSLDEPPHTAPPPPKQSLNVNNEGIFKLPTTLPSLIPPAISTRREIRKPTPPSPAIVSKAMQQMDSMVPIPPPPSTSTTTTTTTTTSAPTIPKYTLDSVISANEYEDVAINNKEN